MRMRPELLFVLLACVPALALSCKREERTFNASGEANGQFAGNRMTLSIAGGGFSGSMSVVFGGSRQVVTIATEGISLKSVTVTLLKSG